MKFNLHPLCSLLFLPPHITVPSWFLFFSNPPSALSTGSMSNSGAICWSMASFSGHPWGKANTLCQQPQSPTAPWPWAGLHVSPSTPCVSHLILYKSCAVRVMHAHRCDCPAGFTVQTSIFTSPPPQWSLTPQRRVSQMLHLGLHIL